MPKQYLFAVFISIILLLTGCQSKVDNTELRTNAKDVYVSIKNEIQNDEHMSDYQKDQINAFKDKYINNYNEYKDDKKLLSDMEKLVFGYQFYYIAIGQNEEESAKKKLNDINEALISLDKQFNK